jgi:protein gp37
VEPMLGEMHLGNIFWNTTIPGGVPPWPIEKLDWVICGPETGPGARPMNLDWARSLRDQCVAAGVPFFYKRGELDGKLWHEFPVSK